MTYKITLARVQQLRDIAETMEYWYGIKDATIKMTTEEFLALCELLDLSRLPCEEPET